MRLPLYAHFTGTMAAEREGASRHHTHMNDKSIMYIHLDGWYGCDDYTAHVTIFTSFSCYVPGNVSFMSINICQPLYVAYKKVSSRLGHHPKNANHYNNHRPTFPRPRLIDSKSQ